MRFASHGVRNGEEQREGDGNDLGAERRERERERGNVDGQKGGGLFANVDVPSRGRIRRGQCHGGQKGSKGGVWTCGAQLNKFRGPEVQFTSSWT